MHLALSRANHSGRLESPLLPVQLCTMESLRQLINCILWRRRHRKLPWLTTKMEIVDGFVVVLFYLHRGKCKHWTPLHQEAAPVFWKWDGMLRTMSAKAKEHIPVLGLFPPSTWYGQQSMFFMPEWPSSRTARIWGILSDAQSRSCCEFVDHRKLSGYWEFWCFGLGALICDSYFRCVGSVSRLKMTQSSGPFFLISNKTMWGYLSFGC